MVHELPDGASRGCRTRVVDDDVNPGRALQHRRHGRRHRLVVRDVQLQRLDALFL
jgi:hypothetical protein